MILQEIVKSKNDIKKLAIKIASLVRPQTIITLTGDLGSGKTFFTSSLINELQKIDNLPLENVTSPTFNLVKIYELKNFSIYHYDLYRLKHFEEIYELDIENAFNNVAIIEWPEIIENILPTSNNIIKIGIKLENDKRIFHINTVSF